MSVLAVNRPTDAVRAWHQIDWAKANADVRRLRQRIFRAEKAGNHKLVKNLQKLMLRSHSNTLVSVRRVTQLSSGKKTPGVDGVKALTPAARRKLAAEVHAASSPRCKPVKRIYIPKRNGTKRPLGIPTIMDRAHQARVKNALEPQWEARFDRRSYGFRPGRSAQDAIMAIWNATTPRQAGAEPKRQWILDADLTTAFDSISHEFLLQALKGFPAKGMIQQWLKAGIVEEGAFFNTEEGTPQGGVISPLVMNIMPNGMEEAAGCRGRTGTRPAEGTPVLVRYADDFVVMCHTKEDAEEVKRKLTTWLAKRGLAINERKTSIRSVYEGFDFLGFTVKRRPAQKGHQAHTLYIPSKEAVERAKTRIRDDLRKLNGSNAAAVIMTLNPFIRGWSMYYRSSSAAKTFKYLDSFIWERTYKWATRMYSKKGKRWVARRYYPQVGTRKWVFCDPHKEGRAAHLLFMSDTKILRHVQVTGGNSLDNPELTEYWNKRRTKKAKEVRVTPSKADMAYRQRGLCPICKTDLIQGAEFQPDDVRDWISWFEVMRNNLHADHLIYRRHGGSDHRSNLRLVHAECHRIHHAGDGERGLPRKQGPA